jgi:hypothetical protein
MNLFNIVPEDFFKPLTSKYKNIYIDCLEILYDSYKTELSFGVEKEVILLKLTDYFEKIYEDMIFDDEVIAKDSRAKANQILLELKKCGWIEYDQENMDFTTNVNLREYAVTMIESFHSITSEKDMEYQSMIYQIHSTLNDKEAYEKPYEYIIKSVINNTEELINDLKKLNTEIKKRIDNITKDKEASEIIEDFFKYQNEIVSKSYHIIKTSDNISHFRIGIIEKLRLILDEKPIFNKALEGFKLIEEVDDDFEAEKLLVRQINQIINSFNRFDEIIREIDTKHTKYITSAVSRAKFLLSNTSNTEGKLSKIINYLGEEFNKEENIQLNDYIDESLLKIFDIFPQNFLDGDSLYVIPISREIVSPSKFSELINISDEERKLKKLAMEERNKRRFSRKNINKYVEEKLGESHSLLVSTLPLNKKRDFIRIIFINLYGRYDRSKYEIETKDDIVTVNQYRFRDFIIRRKNTNENI